MGEAPFGGLAITFRQLLDNLEHHCGCTIRKLANFGDIPDTDESVSGDLYEVTRQQGYAQWYAHLEVYSETLPVLGDVLRSISLQLNLPIERILGKRDH